MDKGIKNCPFCGKKPIIEKEIQMYKDTGSLIPSHDFEVYWKIKCNSCGTSKESYGKTYYKLNKDGNFEMVAQSYDKEYEGYNDKRQEVIDKWNKRFS